MRLTPLVLAFALAGCPRPAVVENPSPFDEDDPAAIDEPAGEPAPAPQTAVVAAAVDPTITRAQLDEVLDRGPGPYRPGFDVDPVVDGDSLRGWLILRWDYGWPGLRAGDVLIDVNGVAIVMPSDLDALWQSLRGATELTIRIEREGQPLALRFEVATDLE